MNINWLDILDSIQIDSNCSQVEQDILCNTINYLIDKRKKGLTEGERNELKQRLRPIPFDVYGKVANINVGENIIINNTPVLQ